MSIGAKIFAVIIVLVILYWIVGWFLSGASTKLSGMHDGRQIVTIDPSTLPINNNTNNYSYSTWIYVNDWNYRFGEQKTILERKDITTGTSPSISLGAIQNNLIVSTAVYPSSGNASDAPINHSCNIPNVPLQKWVNITISLNGRTMDVYINGKLTRTCVLPGVAKVNSQAPVKITPGGGFSGWTARTSYYANSLTPQEAWNIYAEGYGGSWLSGLFNKYKLRVSVLEDNISRTSFEI